jgi:lon-related putative ATP-dependent protease
VSDDRLVPLERLRAVCDPASLNFECTDEVAPLGDFVGQDRATRALEFGLGLQRPGYNIFVTGLTGTGRTSAILEYIRRQVEERKTAENHSVRDWCYVYNFDDPDRPNAIAMEPGTGKRFRDAMNELLDTIRSNLARVFTSEEYERQRRLLIEGGGERGQAEMREAQQQAAAAGFSLSFLPSGVNLLPMKDGRSMTPEEFSALSPEERSKVQEGESALGKLVNDVGERLRAIERDVGNAIQQLDRQVVAAVVSFPFDSVTKEFGENEEVPQFLQQLRDYTMKSADFLRQFAVSPMGTQTSEGTLLATVASAPVLDPFLAFRVNLLVDNSGLEGPPIVTESNPTWSNLFGRIDRRAYMGTYLSDHTMLKAGAVHRANGGYLVLNYTDIATRPGAWEGLKRMIRTREVRIEDPMEQYGLLSPQGLRPEPVAVNVKLVVAGDPGAYFLHSAYEEEFWEMFKVKADFDYQIPRSVDNVLAYAAFVCQVAHSDGVRHFDRSGVARLVEWGSRAVDDQEKLSARFGRMRDVIVEADYWAGKDGAELVTGEHVDRAIDEKVYRLNMVEERIRELIERGTIMIDIEGEVAGQVNGLAVLDFGDLRFGRPARITARVHPGQRGVVSIDRESHLSGKIHDKGVLTLTGFLGSHYAQERPLSLSATVSFEQGYEMVDGDSASLAETCAILSAISGLPVKQGIAMTGSINQNGEVQPIGGVNQKVEGFHDVCKAVGFTDEQGVIVPSRNVKNLMLRDDVMESVRAGRFRVWEVSTLDEALEVLTGVKAGKRKKDGKYPQRTVHHAVETKLREMSETLKKASAARGKKKDAAAEEEGGEDKAPEPEKKPGRKPRKPPDPGPREG